MNQVSRDFDPAEQLGSWVFLSLLTALMTPASLFMVDLIYLPDRMHSSAVACRSILSAAGFAGLAVRYWSPEWIARNWKPALLSVYIFHVLFLLWFEYESTDLLRSRYYIGIITITGLTQLFRVQYEVLVLYVVSILLYVFLQWDSPTLVDAIFDFCTIGVFFFGMTFTVFRVLRKLRNEIRQRDDLSAIINHGWSFPLQAIADLAANIRSKDDLAEAPQLELIEHQARIMQAEAAAIVDLSVGRPRRRHRGVSVFVVEVLRLSVQTFTVARKGAIDLPSPLPLKLRVVGTEQDLFRVFTILLSNSISYSPDRRCRIRIVESDSVVKLHFSNRIAAPIDETSVFEKYVTFSGGTGIGLFDARSVVEESLGGRISCRTSGRVEVTFTVMLPKFSGKL